MSSSSDSGLSVASARLKGAGRPIACKRCNTFITSPNCLVSRAYRGYRGKAALYSAVSSETTSVGPETVQLMQTGAYTVCPLTCTVCNAYLGWEFAHAHEESEAWKTGHCVLELTCVQEQASRDDLDDALRGTERETHPSLALVQPRSPLADVLSFAATMPRRPKVSPQAAWRKTVVKLNANGLLGHHHPHSRASRVF